MPTRLAAYALLAASTAAVLAWGLRLDRRDWRVPFASGADTLLILPMVKSAVETGTHWRNERLGAPGVQELYDYPVIDSLHFAAVRLAGLATGDAIVAFNIYYVLTWPLAAVACAASLRGIGAGAAGAAFGGLAYAFLPYHALRGQEHYFLSAYYLVPPAAMLALWVCRGRLPFFRLDGEHWLFAPLRGDGVKAALIAAAVSCAGAYYAFFSCLLLAVAGVYGWAATGRWRAAASAGFIVAVVVAGGLLNNAPTFLYQARAGHNAAYVRTAAEAEHHGLKLAQLLLPVANHQSRTLAAVQDAYDTPDRPLQTENKTTPLGLVGAAGLLGLLACAVLPAGRGWPLGPLAGLALAAVLFGTVGGLGSVYNLLATPAVRAQNRVVVFIAFFALAAVVFAVERLVTGRAARRLAFALLAVLAVWDQSPRPWFHKAIITERDRVAAEWRADAAFFAEVEAAVPNGTLFTLPVVRYPEDLGVPLPQRYAPVRGYLHSKTLRFSYGAMRRREADQWQREVAAEPPDAMVRRLAARGFDGILLDRRGYTPPEADSLVAALIAAAGPGATAIRHPDGAQLVLDLRPARDRLGRELAATRHADGTRVRVLWLAGFDDDGPGTGGDRRWCAARGEASVVNPTDRPRTVRLTMAFGTGSPNPTELRIESAIWSDRLAVTADAAGRGYEIVVPPGRHAVAFRCPPPPGYRVTDHRHAVFYVGRFRLTE